MDSIKHEMEELIKEYNSIKHHLFEFTTIYHDDMHFDIIGYREQLDEGKFDKLEALRCQVVAVRMLLKAHKNIKYIFFRD